MFTSHILTSLLFNEMKKVKAKNAALLTKQFWACGWNTKICVGKFQNIKPQNRPYVYIL